VNAIALIPAAGHSRRIGRPKLSLPLGDSTVLGTLLDRLRDAGIEQRLVVVGSHVPELVPLCRKHGAEPLLLEADSPEMRTTLEAGFAWIGRRAPDFDAVLLCPGDHPQLDPAVVRRLLESRDGRIVIPTFVGKRGHPTLIPRVWVARLREVPIDQGLNTFFRSHPEAVCEIAVESSRILDDIDTISDYERLKQHPV